MKGEIAVTVPEGETFLAWIKREPEVTPVPAKTYETASWTYNVRGLA